MAFYLSPLVDVNEIDLSTTVPAVATSIGVIALTDTYKGAEKKQTFIASEDDLIRAFGEPTDDSYIDLLSATGFLKYGNKLYATRVMPPDATFGGVTIPVGSGFTVDIDTVDDGVVATFDNGTLVGGSGYTGASGVATTGGTGTGLTVDTTGTGALTAIVVNDGGANYTVGDTITVTGGGADATIDVLTVTDGIVTAVSIATAGVNYSALQTVDVQGGTGSGLVVQIDTVSAGVPQTISVYTGGSAYLTSDDGLTTFSGADYYDASDSVFDATADTANDAGNGGGVSFSALPSEDPDDWGTDVTVDTAGDKIWAIAASRGAWGDNVRISFLDKTTQTNIKNEAPGYASGDWVDGGSYEVFASIDSDLAEDTDFLVVVQVQDQRKSTFVLKESFNVSTDTNVLDDTGNKLFAEDVINNTSAYMRIALDSSLVDQTFDPALVQDGWYTFTGGANGTYEVGELNSETIDAYRLYENPEEVDVNIIIDSGKSDTIKSDLIVMCEARFDCMAVLDVPSSTVINNKGNETTDIRTWRNSTFNENTSYAAVYGNWLEVFDKFNQKYRWIPASGYVAGIYAKTDDVADPWWAPAGLNRAIITGVRRLAWNPKQGNRDILYSNGINPIVSFAGEGKVVWGQKTMLAKSSAFNRVNVRRLFMILEKAISTASKYFLFEPNDPATRNQLVGLIEPFLRDVKARRGVYDYKIVCDTTNNTPERIDRNELWCNIFIQPTRSAEFIVLNFVATKTGASFDEAASAVG